MPFCTVKPSSESSRYHRHHSQGDDAEVNIYYRTYGKGDCKILMIMGVAATHEAWWPQIKPLTGTDVPNEVEDDDIENDAGDNKVSTLQEEAGEDKQLLQPSPAASAATLDHHSNAAAAAAEAATLRDRALRPAMNGHDSADDLACGKELSVPLMVDSSLLAQSEAGLRPEAVCGSRSRVSDAGGREEESELGSSFASSVFVPLCSEDQNGGSSVCENGDKKKVGWEEKKGKGEEALTGRMVCVLDNRGVGKSTHPLNPKEYTTEIMAADALAVANELGWATFHVVGHSMGGMIACKLAAMAPLRVRSLALISTSSGGFDILPRLELRVFSIISRMMNAKTPEQRAEVDLDCHFSDAFLNEHVDGKPRRHHLHQEYVGHLSKKGSMQPKHATNGQINACWTHGMTQHDVKCITGTRIPVSVIHGSEDVIAHASLGRRIAQRLHKVARLVEVPGGHMVIRERVDEVNAALMDLVDAAQANVSGLDWSDEAQQTRAKQELQQEEEKMQKQMGRSPLQVIRVCAAAVSPAWRRASRSFGHRFCYCCCCCGSSHYDYHLEVHCQ